MIALPALLAIAGGIAGATLLRRAWAERQRERPDLIAAGWAVIGGTILADAAWIGWIRGGALAVVAVGIGALIVLIRGRTVKATRAARATTAPSEPDEPSRAWRGVLKTILAGPLGLAAAVAIAYCAAAWVPGAPPTRVLIGGLTIPIVWALAMIWTLADTRLMRSLATIVTTTLTGFALAALQGPV